MILYKIIYHYSMLTGCGLCGLISIFRRRKHATDFNPLEQYATKPMEVPRSRALGSITYSRVGFQSHAKN